MSAQPDKGLDDPQGDKGRRTQAEVQPHQHQHGWSRVQHEKNGRWAAQEGRQGGHPSQKFTAEAADDSGDPAEPGPQGDDDVTSGEHWSAPHKLPSPSQNTLPCLWRQHFHLSPVCCPGQLQHPRCPSALRPQAAMCIHRSRRAWAHSTWCHALPVTIVTPPLPTPPAGQNSDLAFLSSGLASLSSLAGRC